MATGSVYRRCSCRDRETKKTLGSECPKRKNRAHGIWGWRLELPADEQGQRRPGRRGGFTSKDDAQAELDHARALLALAEDGDEEALRRIGATIEQALSSKQPLPDLDEVRRRVRAGIPISELPTVGAWLTSWLSGRRRLAANTYRSYESHIRLYLAPYLGEVRLDRLKIAHIAEMFDAIEEFNERIVAARNSRKPDLRAKVKGRRPVWAASQQRIRATLRAALNAAIVEQLITFNPAAHVELAAGARPKALLWTPERIERWRRTGKVPSPVMVWTPEQLGRFLDHAVHDRLYALYHLIAFRGLRRGEACGAHWSETDLATGVIHIRWQLLQLGWETELSSPKTDESDAIVALDTDTVAVLKAHRARQGQEKAATGDSWPDHDLIFTRPDGQPLHPAAVTDHFRELAAEAGLPPVRLHDLRHGAATNALAAGVDPKVIQDMLRHSSITITTDTYTSVLPEVARAAADATARIVPRNVIQHSEQTAIQPVGAEIRDWKALGHPSGTHAATMDGEMAHA